MKTILSNDAPSPAGHYSQAIEHDGLLYVSGQLPIGPAGEVNRSGSIEDQTEQSLANLNAVLKAGGSDRDHVLKLTVYISDIELWGRVNSVLAGFFGGHKPVRTVVPTRELHFSSKIEVDAIAVIGSR